MGFATTVAVAALVLVVHLSAGAKLLSMTCGETGYEVGVANTDTSTWIELQIVGCPGTQYASGFITSYAMDSYSESYFQLRYQTLSGQWQLFAFDYGSSACVEYYEPPITIYATALAFDEPNRLLWMFGDSGFSSVISFAVKPFSGVLKVTNLTVPLEPGAFWLSPNKVHTFSRNSSRPYFYIVTGRPKQAAPVLTRIELFPPSSHVLLPVVGTVDWELDEERNLLVGAAVTPNANKLNITALDLQSLNSTSFSIAFGNGTLQTVHTSTIDTTQTRLFVGVITKELQYYIVTIDYALHRLMLATHVEEFLDDIRFLQFARNSK